MFTVGRRSAGRGLARSNAILDQTRNASALFSPERISPDLNRPGQSALFDPTQAAADQIGAVVGVLRKARDWAAVRIESKLLSKIEKVAPDILFDVEKKLVFTSNVALEAAAFFDFAERAMKQLHAALEAQNDEAATEAAAALSAGMLGFLTAIGNLYTDYQSFFGRSIYDRFRENLNTMPVEDRRSIEAFYSRFEVATTRMGRIFGRDIPVAAASDNLNAASVFGWVNELGECIERLIDSAELLVKR